MIFPTLVLFAVSFLLTALLAPKPKIEDAKPQNFDPASFPRATEDAPIPLVLGTVDVPGVNTLYYGGYKIERITQRVRTGLFRKKTVTKGYKYRISVHLGVAMGPEVQLRKIIIDDKEVFSQAIAQSDTLTTSFTGRIDKEDLFGGDENGGGFVSDFRFYSGGFAQGIDTYMQNLARTASSEPQVEESNAFNTLFNLAFNKNGNSGEADPEETPFVPEQIPAYRGTACLALYDAYIGESPSLRSLKVQVSAFTRYLGQTSDPRINTDDINPAEAIVMIMRDPWRGLGISSSLIDLDSFRDAAEVLANEDNGVSFSVTSTSTGKELIAEILRQIDGTIFESPETGQITLKLIRKEDSVTYDFTEHDIVSITGFSKTSYEDVISEVRVSYAKRGTSGEDGRVALAQDMAVMNMIGRKKSTVMSFPFCYSAKTANDIAARELSRLSNPLFRMTVELRKRSYNVRPGDVITISWPEYGLVDLRVRVQKYDLGELLNNRIVFECLQDAFASDSPVFEIPDGTAWIPPTNEPVLINSYIAVEMPYFFNKKLEFPSPAGYTNAIVFARRPQIASTGYTVLLSPSADNLANNVDVTKDPDSAIYAPSFILDEDVGFYDGFETGLITQIIANSPMSGSVINPPEGSEQRDGEVGIYYVNGEYIGIENYSGNTQRRVNLMNVRRGLLGSQIKMHPAGTVVYGITANQLGDGLYGDVLPNNGTVFYKAIDKVGTKEYEKSSVLTKTLTVNRGIDRPLRPRYVQIDGSRMPGDLTAAVHTITFRPSNKDAAQIQYESDAAQTPASPEKYRVEVWIDGVENVGLRQTAATSTSVNVNLAGLTGEVQFRVYSVNDANGLISANYAFLNTTIAVSFLELSGSETGIELLSGDAKITMDDKLKVTE